MAGSKLEVVIIGNASAAINEFKKLAGAADDSGTKVKSSLDGTTSSMSKMATGIAKIGAVVAAGAFLKGAISEAEQAQKVTAQVQQVINTTGGAANVTAGHVDSLASSLAKVSGVDEEVIAKGEGVLLTFTSIRNEAGAGNDIFDRTTKAALDMSTVMGTDLQSSVLQLGKALQNPITGMTALRRVGVSFTQQQQDQIKTLAQSGQSLQAQKMILSEVEKEFGGAAAAMATPLDKAKESVKEMERAVGNDLAPAVRTGASAVSGLASAFSSMPEPVQVGIIAFVTLGAGATILVPKLVALRKALAEMAAAEGITGTFGRLGQSLSSIVPKATLALAATEALGHGVESIFGNSLHGATVSVDELAASFNSLGSGNASASFGALGGSVDSVVAKMRSFRYETGGVQGALNSASSAVVGFVMGSSKFDVMKDNIKSIDTALAGMVTGGHAAAAADAVNELTAAAEHQGKSAEWVTSFLKQYETAVANQSADQQHTSALLQGTTGSLDEQADAWLKNLSDLNAFHSGLSSLYTAFDKGADSQAQFTLSLQNLSGSWDTASASFMAGTNALDLNSASGAKNYETGKQVRDAILAVADANYQQTGSADAATAAAGPLIDSFRRTLGQLGLNTAQQDAYLYALGLTPAQVNSAIQLSGAQSALDGISGVHSALNNLNGTVATVTVYTKIFNALVQFAQGKVSALGGRANLGDTILVGERGPELFVPDKPGRIIPNNQVSKQISPAPMPTKAASLGASPAPVVYVSVYNAGSVLTERDLVQTVRTGLLDAQRKSPRPILPGVS